MFVRILNCALLFSILLLSFSSVTYAACKAGTKNYACCYSSPYFGGPPSYSRIGGGCGYTRAASVVSCQAIPGYPSGIKTEWRKSSCEHLNKQKDVKTSYSRTRYREYGIEISDFDAIHWDTHRNKSGQTQAEWEQDFHKDIVERLFSQCHDSIGNDLQHWFDHSFNVSPSKFVEDVRNDWRCK